ncbi:MAG: CHAT domain-containing tetratricopeptide repeat protein [Rhizobiaceae bacterium]
MAQADAETEARARAIELNAEAARLLAKGRNREAVPAAQAALEQSILAYGDDTAEISYALTNVGLALERAGRFEEAETHYRKALAIDRRFRAPDHPNIPTDLYNLANVTNSLGRFEEALDLNRKALAIREEAKIDDERAIARLRNNIGLNLWQLSRFAEAEQSMREALAILESVEPDNLTEIATIISNIGVIQSGMNRLADAEASHRRALEMRQGFLPEDHPDIAFSLFNLADVYVAQNRLSEAEDLHRRALAIREKSLPPNHPDTILTLNNLGENLRKMGRYGEAEELFRRALGLWEETLPHDHRLVALGLTNLGQVYANMGLYKKAEPILRRALAIRRKILPENHIDIAFSLNNLAVVVARQGDAAASGLLLREALAIFEKVLPESHPIIAQTLSNIGDGLRQLRQFDEAEVFINRAVDLRERFLPDGHPDIAEGLTVLGVLQWSRGQLDEADRTLRRALAVREKGLPEGHVDVAASLEYLADLSNARGDHEGALDLIGRAVQIRSLESNRKAGTWVNWRWLAALRGDAALRLWRRDGDAANPRLVRERRSAFADLQWESAGGTGGAIAAAAARAQAEDPAVGPLARQRDELTAEIRDLNARFLAISTSQDVSREERKEALARLRGESGRKRQRLEAVEAEIARLFPAYAELAGAAPVSVDELRGLLDDGEAFLSITPFGKYGFFYGYDRTGGVFAWLTDAGNAPALAHALRCSAAGLLDPACSADNTGDAQAGNEVRGATVLAAAGGGLNVFDLDLAYDLYQRLFPEPVREFIKGKKLLIAPAPELIGLPWHLLATEPPPPGWRDTAASRMVAYREAAWLFQKHPSISMLPTVASLRALRRAQVQNRGGGRGMLGIGDPAIGRTAAEREALPLNCGQAASIVLAGGNAAVLARSAGGEPATVFSGERSGRGFAIADPELVRRQPRLADTRCELLSVAASLAGRGVSTELLLGGDATETRLKRLDQDKTLRQYDILHFATHGLLAGDLGLGEPGLILTPPETASVVDDGILTASEIATLTLAADWVVLSACNSAAGNERDAEALSGLARSFFYAGAKSLLVSSWPVYSRAAVEVTTRVFAEMDARPQIGRAEALALAMRQTLAAADSEFEANPVFWAPFMLVGEGNR